MLSALIQIYIKMCVPAPLKVIKVVSRDAAVVELDGKERFVDISLIKNIRSEDYILVHDGLGIRRLDKFDLDAINKILV